MQWKSALRTARWIWNFPKINSIWAKKVNAHFTCNLILYNLTKPFYQSKARLEILIGNQPSGASEACSKLESYYTIMNKWDRFQVPAPGITRYKRSGRFKVAYQSLKHSSF